MSQKKGKRISVWNWLGTLFVCGIPGINIIALILILIFARSASKRNFAIATLLLTIILAALLFAAFMIFPGTFTSWASLLRGEIA